MNLKVKDKTVRNSKDTNEAVKKNGEFRLYAFI